MTNEELTTLWIGALRYYLGRQTYAVSDFCDVLRQNWPYFPQRLKDLILREVEEEFKRDDNDRAQGQEIKALGHDCDRAEWEQVRKLWEVDNA